MVIDFLLKLRGWLLGCLPKKKERFIIKCLAATVYDFYFSGDGVFW
ncbi:hypothetical protein Patl1_13748 [Pistacia atlantica]|uniref:Uncharacterized protein n=1 Tax=Pistacia atlantica TaxID=434234 RepID=A0ACC1ATX3_9ROSI|nr:hypothetical protein Patl1_13748 [Pistacia atlantica]